MVYPPTLPPDTRTDSTVAAGTHAADHNALVVAISSLLTELGASPSGDFADLTTRLEGMLTEAAISDGGGLAASLYSPTIGLFSAAPGKAIASSVTVVRTSGFNTPGIGGAVYVYDAAVDASYVTTNPLTSFRAANGRGFRLNNDQLPSPQMFGAKADGTDDAVALDAWLDYITARDVGTARCDGAFSTSQPLYLGNALTKLIKGRASITATGSGAAFPGGGRVLTVEGWIRGTWEYLKCQGPAGGVTDYAARTWATALFITNGASRCSFPFVEASDFGYGAVVCAIGNTSGQRIGLVKATNCGSGMVSGATRYGLSTTWSNPINAGASNSVAQTATIDVAALPPTYTTDGSYGGLGDSQLFVRILDTVTGKTRLHHVTGAATLGDGTKRLNVFPWVNPAITPGTLDYVYGGAVITNGADSNVHTIDKVDALRCGIVLGLGGLYPPHVLSFISQVCGSVIVFGKAANGACLGGRIDSAYFESSSEHIIYLARPGSTNVYNWIGNEYALDLSKCYVAGAPKLSGTFADSTSYTAFSNTSLAYRGDLLRYEKPSGGAAYSSNTIAFEIRRPDMRVLVARTSPTITGSIDVDVHRLMGYDTALITCVGQTGTGGPTGTVTFAVPAGYTLNGGAVSLAYQGFAGPADFLYRFDVANLNVIVERKATPSGVATTAELAAIANAVNTTGKYAGKCLLNTTTGKLVIAVGSTAGSVWQDTLGATAHTPV